MKKTVIWKKRNAHLENIFAERKLNESELKQKFTTINSELEKMRKELLSKSMEVGRAYLSDMALHNISNALTPHESSDGESGNR